MDRCKFYVHARVDHCTTISQPHLKQYNIQVAARRTQGMVPEHQLSKHTFQRDHNRTTLLRPASQHRQQSSLSSIAIGPNHNFQDVDGTNKNRGAPRPRLPRLLHRRGQHPHNRQHSRLLHGQYERAGRALSTRQGVHRRRLVQIFLGLALACFVVVTTLKYANPVARADVGNTLAGAHAGSTANVHEARSAEGGYVGNGDAGMTEQRSFLPGD